MKDRYVEVDRYTDMGELYVSGFMNYLLCAISTHTKGTCIGTLIMTLKKAV